MELREENTVDVLIVGPGNQAEFVTLPIKGHPFDTFFQGQPYRTGQHDGYTFAFLIHGKQYGLTKNISIGSDLLFQDIYGPIVFAYPLACVTLEDALDIVRKYGLPKDVIDHRLFTHRIPLPGDGPNFDDLIYDIPWFRWIPSYEESQKYIVQGYDELVGGRVSTHYVRPTRVCVALCTFRRLAPCGSRVFFARGLNSVY